MTYSPELERGLLQPAPELLRTHDADPYGYIAHAAAALEWMPSYDKNEAYGLVARYASDIHDVALMKKCVDEIDTAEQWKVFAHEARNNGSTLDVGVIISMSEAVVESEMAPESDRNWWSLSNIYASQLDIAVHSGMEVVEPFERFSLAVNRLQDKVEDAYPGDSLRRDAVHMLLRAGHDELAARLAEGIVNETRRQEYEDSLPLYKRKQDGKSLAIKQLTEKNRAVFCELDPEVYMKVLEEQFWHPDQGDITPRLRAGYVRQARQRYDALLKPGNVSQLSRLRMALEMASVNPPEDNDEHDLIAEVTRLTSVTRQVGEGVNDIGANLKQKEAVKEQVGVLCGKIGELPFSRRRIDLTLEVAAVQHAILQGSRSSAEACDRLIFDTWHQVVRALTTDSASGTVYQPQVRELWWKFREVGFNFKKLKGIDLLFAEYSHPRFRPVPPAQ